MNTKNTKNSATKRKYKLKTITKREQRKLCSLAAKKNWEKKNYNRAPYRSFRVPEPLYFALRDLRGEKTWSNFLAGLAGLEEKYNDRRLNP